MPGHNPSDTSVWGRSARPAFVEPSSSAAMPLAELVLSLLAGPRSHPDYAAIVESWSQRHLEICTGMLGHNEPLVRARAAAALGYRRYAKAAPAILSLLCRAKATALEQYAAAGALGRLGYAAAEAPLRHLANRPCGPSPVSCVVGDACRAAVAAMTRCTTGA